MEDELAALLVAARYERTPWRLDHRNGFFARELVTELGAITDLRVPRRRLVPYRPSFLARAARRTGGVDHVLRQAFLRGLSTRETAALAETLTGVPLSRGGGQPPGPAARRPGRARSTVGRSRSRPATCSSTGSGCRSGAAGQGPEAGHPRGLRDRRRRPPRAARLPPGDAESAAAWSGCLRVARRARSRSGRGRPRHRRRGGRDRGGGRRGLPGCRPPALLDPPHPQPPRRAAARRAQGLPALVYARCTGPGPAARRRRLLALGDGLACPPPGPRPAPRARPRRPARGLRPARLHPRQPAHDQPPRTRLPRAPPAPPPDRRPRRPAVGRPDPLRPGVRLNELLARRPLAAFTQDA